MVKAIRGIANPLGTVDSYSTVIESIANNSGTGVPIRNRHKEEIGQGFLHMEGDNVVVTGYVNEDSYADEIETAGLSVGFNLAESKAREVDGVAYYKNVNITEVSLTPNPANAGAGVTGVREKEEKGENMTQENTIAELIADEKVKAREAKAEAKKLREQLDALQKDREAKSLATEKPQDKTREALGMLGDKMREMPSRGFMKEQVREVTNAGNLVVANALASLVDKYAKKSGIFDSAYKARFQGMTLAEDGVSDDFLKGMFEAGDDKNRAQTIGKRSLLPKMAEAYLEMDKATVLQANDSSALSEYVMSIMPNRVIQKVEYNMMYGTGTNGIYGLGTANADGWTPQVEYTSENIYEAIVDGVAGCSISDVVKIAMNPKTYAQLRKAKGTDGHPIFEPLATKQQVANALGADTIETRVWMKEGDIAIWNPSEFVLTGNFTMDNFTDFDLRYNVEQWLAEILVGGSIRGKERSVFLKLKAEA